MFYSFSPRFFCGLLRLGEVVDIVGHGSEHLLLRDATHAGIVGAHGYVLQVVQFAEFVPIPQHYMEVVTNG